MLENNSPPPFFAYKYYLNLACIYINYMLDRKPSAFDLLTCVQQIRLLFPVSSSFNLKIINNEKQLCVSCQTQSLHVFAITIYLVWKCKYYVIVHLIFVSANTWETGIIVDVFDVMSNGIDC